MPRQSGRCPRAFADGRLASVALAASQAAWLNHRLTYRATLAAPGEVSEWPKERDWKSRTCRKVGRGFESLPLRFPEPPVGFAAGSRA